MSSPVVPSKSQNLNRNPPDNPPNQTNSDQVGQEKQPNDETVLNLPLAQFFTKVSSPIPQPQTQGNEHSQVQFLSPQLQHHQQLIQQKIQQFLYSNNNDQVDQLYSLLLTNQNQIHKMLVEMASVKAKIERLDKRQSQYLIRYSRKSVVFFNFILGVLVFWRRILFHLMKHYNFHTQEDFFAWLVSVVGFKYLQWMFTPNTLVGQLLKMVAPELTTPSISPNQSPSTYSLSYVQRPQAQHFRNSRVNSRPQRLSHKQHSSTVIHNPPQKRQLKNSQRENQPQKPQGFVIPSVPQFSFSSLLKQPLKKLVNNLEKVRQQDESVRSGSLGRSESALSSRIRNTSQNQPQKHNFSSPASYSSHPPSQAIHSSHPSQAIHSNHPGHTVQRQHQNHPNQQSSFQNRSLQHHPNYSATTNIPTISSSRNYNQLASSSQWILPSLGTQVSEYVTAAAKNHPLFAPVGQLGEKAQQMLSESQNPDTFFSGSSYYKVILWQGFRDACFRSSPFFLICAAITRQNPLFQQLGMLLSVGLSIYTLIRHPSLAPWTIVLSLASSVTWFVSRQRKGIFWFNLRQLKSLFVSIFNWVVKKIRQISLQIKQNV